MCHETWNVIGSGEVRGEVVLKNYNDRVDELGNVIQLMKARILELEQELKNKNQ